MAMLRNDCTQALNRFALVGSIKIRHKQLGREEGGKSARAVNSAQKVPNALHIIIVQKEADLTHGNGKRAMKRHGGEDVINSRHVNVLYMTGITRYHLVDKRPKLLTVTVFEKLGATLPARANNQDVLSRGIAFLTLESKRESKRNVANLIIGETISVLLRKYRGRIKRHRECKGEPLLNVGKQRVIDAHAVLESNGKRHDMSSQIHT